MFNGQKIVAIKKSTVAAKTGFGVSAMDSFTADVEQIASDYFSAVDQWASAHGYEFCGVSNDLIIFKRLR